jgi:thermosome
MAKVQGQPILIMPESANRIMGRNAQRINIMAARAVGEVVRTTLGPRGMDKMLVDTLGDIVVTNDGVTILEEMEIEHPAAKMMVEVAKTQEAEVGDGTTSAVVIAGELLKRAEELLDQSIHSQVVISGYRQAAEKSQEYLKEIAKEIDVTDRNILTQISKTTLNRLQESGVDHLAALSVEAVMKVAEQKDGKWQVDIDDIKVEKKAGGSLEDSNLIDGVVLDKEVVHSGMPKMVKEAKIALVDTALEVKETETDAEIRITSPDQLEAFLKQEEKMLREMTDRVINSGANVLLCQKGIDDMAQHYLAKAGILAIRRVKKSDMAKLAKATGARVVTNLNDLGQNDLGYAREVSEEKLAGEAMTFIRGCKDPKAVTILIRGGTEHIAAEGERSISDAIKVLGATLKDGRILGGGGAPEIALAMRLRQYAQSIGGREQLAIEAFAKALEIIPRSLAENSGANPIDVLVELKAVQEKGQVQYGYNVFTGQIEDVVNAGIVEPIAIKTQALKSASEAAMMILKIDDVVAASELRGGGGGGMPPGMPPGMGGMPPGMM